MTDLQQIINKMPEGTLERDLENNFVIPFLNKLGFNNDCMTLDTQNFQGYYDGKDYGVRPDIVCWAGTPKESAPLLIVEVKKVDTNKWSEAVEATKKSLCVAGSDTKFQNYPETAKFGIACNGFNIQLFQRHGKICVPRTPVLTIKKDYPDPIESAIYKIQNYLDKPRKALTLMLWNNKGGIGKTTITAHLSAALASIDLDKKVLIVNFDLQGDINALFNLASIEQIYKDQCANNSPTIYKALKDVSQGLGWEKYDDLIWDNRIGFDNIHLIPGDLSMFDVDAENNFSNRELLLKNLLTDAGFYEEYDYIFIDASPSWRGIAEVAAHASDIIIPIIDGKFAINAYQRLKKIYLQPNHTKEGKWNIETSEICPTIHGYITNTFHEISDTKSNDISKKLENQNCLGALKYYEHLASAIPIKGKKYRDKWEEMQNTEIHPASQRNFYIEFLALANKIF